MNILIPGEILKSSILEDFKELIDYARCSAYNSPLPETAVQAIFMAGAKAQLAKDQKARPDKEKIAKWLFKDSLHPTSKIDWEGKWESLTKRGKDYYHNKADQILALFDVEEAILKERERIEQIENPYLEDTPMSTGWNACHNMILKILKGEK